MAKDPAFLFYSQDFLVGTLTMTDEQVGIYIRLLCLQHQKGELTEQDLIHFRAINYPSIIEKFKQENGVYYNQRLKDESDKRKKHSEHQKANAKKRWQCDGNAKPMPNLCDGNAMAMPLENENENINNNINGVHENKLFPIDVCADVSSRDDVWVMNSGFTDKWRKRFIDQLKATGETDKTLSDFKKHFYNWKKKQPDYKPKIRL